jgi:hypothetical protein
MVFRSDSIVSGPLRKIMDCIPWISMVNLEPLRKIMDCIPGFSIVIPEFLDHYGKLWNSVVIQKLWNHYGKSWIAFRIDSRVSITTMDCTLEFYGTFWICLI